MLNFNFIARDPNGRITRGSMAAISPGNLRAVLQSSGMQLLSLHALRSASVDHQRLQRNWNPLAWLPTRSHDVELALQQLAMMLRSGLDLLSALKTISQQTNSPALAEHLTQIHAAIQTGEPLATAMSKYRCFPPIAVQLVRVGEEAGCLSSVLEQAATQMARRRASMSDVRVALAYPLIVAVAAIGIAIYLIIAVIPELEKFLSAMGRKLPRMTQSLVEFSQWCQLNGAATATIFVAGLIGIVLTRRWPPGRAFTDRYLLRIPIVGSVLRLAGTATLASSLAVMLRSGIQLAEALKIAERLQTNRYLADRVSEARHSVVRGRSFRQALSARHGYMPMLSSMIGVAERTGQLDATLDDVAKFCEVQLQTKIKRLSRLVEPAIIVFAGGVVGYVYMAFFMALMSAGGNIR